MIDKDEMKEIVVCKRCGNSEYYGMIHWHNGSTMCRKCIYQVWRALDPKWEPRERDHVFPLYEDGVNYTKATEATP
jgi:ribosomal protein L40E